MLLCHWDCSADLLWKFHQQFSPERAAMHYSNFKTNCFILKTRLNLKHPAELMKDAAGIFLIWEFKNVWLHCQRSPARAFYVKLQIFHQPGWQSRATLEETTTKKKKNTGKPDATQMIWSVPVSAGNVIHISVLLSLCILFKVQQLSIWAIDPAEIVK